MRKLYCLILILVSSPAFPQNELMDLLDDSEETTKQPVTTYKATRLINMHTTELHSKGELQFIIQHRFGRINSGAYEFFGLDEANIRLGLEYGIADDLDVGIGRSSFGKEFDGFLKYRPLRQQLNGIPVSLAIFSSAVVNSLRVEDSAFDYTFSRRLTYTTQVILSRKFGSSISLQLVPSWVHKNLVLSSEDNNDLFLLGGGIAVAVGRMVDITAEYHYQVNPNSSFETFNSVGFGVDLETGGHVFQLLLTNSRPMIEKGFLTETTGEFFKGDIHLGFNIVRRFQLIR